VPAGRCPELRTAARPLDPPPATATPQTLTRGLAMYQIYCMICHGDTAVPGGVVPDLRYGAALPSADAWKLIVLDGAMVRNGMVPFAQYLKPGDVETIRAYIIQCANDEKKRLAEGG
jgi:quinohemoprotein ethanol dehydrogenase